MNLYEVRNVFERQNPSVENPKGGNNGLLIAAIFAVIGIGSFLYYLKKQKENEVKIKKKV